MRTFLAIVGVVAILVAAGVAAYLSLGAYDVGADSGGGWIDSIAQYTRERSIHARTQHILAPPLTDPAMIAAGAARYDGMCKGCHLAPGAPDNAMRKGMNPQPPALADRRHPEPREDFWFVKHGVKMTAMPAWGRTHSDAELWSVVAFLQQEPKMSPAQYQAALAAGRRAGAGEPDADAG